MARTRARSRIWVHVNEKGEYIYMDHRIQRKTDRCTKCGYKVMQI